MKSKAIVDIANMRKVIKCFFFILKTTALLLIVLYHILSHKMRLRVLACQ